MRICPTCNGEFEDSLRFCPVDGTNMPAERIPAIGAGRVSAEVRVITSDRVKDGRCEVHRIPLDNEPTSRSYGMPLYVPGEDQARQSLFPNALSRIEGGCVAPSLDGPREHLEVLFCKKCRDAERKWFRKHRKNDNGFVRRLLWKLIGSKI